MSVADGQVRSLDPESITAARITAGVTVAIITLIQLVAVIVLLFAVSWQPWIKFLLLGAWIVETGMLVVLALYWPAVSHRHTSYRVGPNGMQIRRGVIWRSETSVPRSRVQHTDVSRGPIERGFGLATLIIHTAGTENASVSLGGLPHELAFRIRDHLIESPDDDAV